MYVIYIYISFGDYISKGTSLGERIYTPNMFNAFILYVISA